MNKEIWLAGGCFWGVEEYFSCDFSGLKAVSQTKVDPALYDKPTDEEIKNSPDRLTRL